MWIVYTLLFVVIVPVLLFGLLLAVVLSGEETLERKYQELSSDIAMRQYERTQEKIALVKIIQVTPEHQRHELWEQYHELDIKDQELGRQEREQLATVNGYSITAQEQDELDRGINPYRMVKS